MKVTALRHVTHDGESYNVGQVFEVTKDEAQALLEAEAVSTGELVEENKVEDKAPKKELEFKITWSKSQLLEFAKSKQLEVDETLTRDEVYKFLKENL